MSGFYQPVRNRIHQTIPDVGVSRRSFLFAGGAAMASGVAASLGIASERLSVSRQPSPAPELPEGQRWGVAMAYGGKYLDIIDLDNNQLLHSFTGLRATHAITPIESLNRFVIHGHRMDTGEGAVIVVQVDPVEKTWQIILNEVLPGGPALHWQPNPEHTEIVFNTVGDGSLHVLNTATLKIDRFPGGGGHSNMAFFDNYLVATDEMAGPTHLSVVDRTTRTVVSKTPVGNWGHGVTVNHETGMAFVWSTEGVHQISLAEKSMGQHQGLMKPLDFDERCWFCWTPQGGQYTHDVSWNPGDVYNPYLLVVDMKNQGFERIATGDRQLQPSYLQVSPGGKWGLASLRGREEIGIFDIANNQFKGTVNVGPAHASFFERDMAFCRDRDFAIVTNTGDRSISLVDLAQRTEVRRISLPRQPLWLKVLSPA